MLGAIGYGAFRLIGLEGPTAGIAAESILIFIVLVWTGSYLTRVFTGKMTFIEQRKRYRNAYDKITDDKLQARFDSLSKEQQSELIKELETENNSLSLPTDL